MSLFEWMEFLSYAVTVVGLPLAIGVFVYEQRKEHANDEEELYQRLSDEYASFLRLVLEHADLRLMSTQQSSEPLTAEQRERKGVMLGLLVSLFERAYLLVYGEHMPRQTRRLWQSWEDYMREWCEREDFRTLLPDLLRGEDPDFCEHILRIARQVQNSNVAPDELAVAS